MEQAKEYHRLLQIIERTDWAAAAVKRGKTWMSHELEAETAPLPFTPPFLFARFPQLIIVVLKSSGCLKNGIEVKEISVRG